MFADSGASICSYSNLAWRVERACDVGRARIDLGDKQDLYPLAARTYCGFEIRNVQTQETMRMQVRTMVSARAQWKERSGFIVFWNRVLVILGQTIAKLCNAPSIAVRPLVSDYITAVFPSRDQVIAARVPLLAQTVSAHQRRNAIDPINHALVHQ